ncbi:HopJ type III effector protein [Veronia pacifica]|uniref:Type III effector n=1 Tax=Veronia pacifica TaxID=1080227 RepID=A0A1C3E932_9GAMM|nr:HopJ type III effector protein [Veronia pacifica]ODA29755.1 type III effector [Veronia pacifica]
MQLEAFLTKLESIPDIVEFEEVITLIDKLYEFSPARFTNGKLINKAGQNTGSCKILAFGKLHNLTEEQTLACFGKFYREDVLGNPSGSDHQNIRNFISTGWEGIHFEKLPLTIKKLTTEA